MKKPFCSLLFSHSSKNALRLPQFLLLTFRRGFRQDMPCLRREKPNAALLMTSLGCPIRCRFTQGTWVYLETYPTTSHGNQPCALAMRPMPHLLWAQAARPELPQSFPKVKPSWWMLVKPWRKVMGHRFRGTRNITMCSCGKKTRWGGIM